MKNKKTRMTALEAAKLNIRAFKTVYRTRKKVLVLRLIKFAFGALTPYLGIWLSARIIDEISGARNSEVLTSLVLWTLGSAALIALIQSFLDRWHDAEQAGMYIHIDHIMSEKMRTMDFADVDSPETHALYASIKQNRNFGGWGLHSVTHHFSSLWSSLFNLGGGLALTVSLFTSKVPEGEYAILNSPWITFLVIALMIGITLFAPVLSNMGGRFRVQMAGEHKFANRLFGFYGWFGRQEKFSADARIFRLSAFCEKYNTDKTGTFGSKGLYARLTKGKAGLLESASAAVGAMFTGIVYLYVCVKGLAGAFGVGSITQYVGAVTLLAGGLGSVISVLGKMRNNAIFLVEVFRFLDIPNKMYQGSLTVEKRRDRDYEIEFRNVSFKYPGSDVYALRNVSIKFKIGERLAVVGRNGSGKTTFIKLLCRLYDPTEGEILLNGIDIRKYDYDNYLSVFSVVFQDFNILSLPLGENVAGCCNFDRIRAEQCLRDAGFGERLDTMPQGLDTFLYKSYDAEGVDISGGEAQKIAIARALYKNAPFIILDEPTAALDPIAEAEIYSKFNEIVGDKTAIYISHRLSSCRFCDEIAVFSDGGVVQMGSHDSLLTEDGLYRELWMAQAQYYNGENQ